MCSTACRKVAITISITRWAPFFLWLWPFQSQNAAPKTRSRRAWTDYGFSTVLFTDLDFDAEVKLVNRMAMAWLYKCVRLACSHPSELCLSGNGKLPLTAERNLEINVKTRHPNLHPNFHKYVSPTRWSLLRSAQLILQLHRRRDISFFGKQVNLWIMGKSWSP